MALKIRDLTPANVDELYPEAGEFHNIRRAWVREMLAKGLRHKVAFDETGQKVAYIEWTPIEEVLKIQGGKMPAENKKAAVVP